MDKKTSPEELCSQPYSRRRKNVQPEHEVPLKKESNEKDDNLPAPPPPPPKDPTPMMLINEISKLFDNHMRQNADPGLNNSYRHLLFHLAHRDGRTQLELAKLTHLKPPTVSVSLAKLESDGYVRRVADPSDLRQTRVFLTDKGRDVDRKAQKAINEIEAKITECMTEEEREQLLVLLLKLRNNLAGDHIPGHEII